MKNKPSIDYERIRRLIIVAVASDDKLMNTLVLKGGNALALVYGVGKRTSLDVDFSMSGDFADLEDAKSRLFAALKDRFDSAGLVVFDESLTAIPPEHHKEAIWGGYRVEFKVVPADTLSRIGADRQKTSREAMTIGPGSQNRKYRIEISKYEYTEGKTEAEIDNYSFSVYTLPMIAAEKLRAICRQMEEYKPRKHPAPRARDFYDIRAIVTEARVDFAAQPFRELVDHMFEAKDVPLSFLSKIADTRDFHAQDWPSVRDTIFEDRRDFDYYFDFVLNETKKLETLWKK